MLCFGYRRLLIPYSEGALGSSAVKKVERHLVKCARCRTELDGIRVIAGVLVGSDMPGAEPADDLWARVSARIADGSAKPAPRSAFAATRGLAAGVAAAAIVAVVGIKLLTPPATSPVAPVDLYAYKAQSSEAKKPAKIDQPKASQPETPAKQGPNVTTPPPPSRTETPKPSRVEPPKRRWFAEKPSGRNAGLPAKVEVAALAYPMAKGVKADTPVADHVYYTRDDVADCSTGGVARVVTPGRPAAAPAPAAAQPRVLGDERVVVASAAFGIVERDADSWNLSADGMATTAAPTTSVVDDLNETEGVLTAALFAYP